MNISKYHIFSLISLICISYFYFEVNFTKIEKINIYTDKIPLGKKFKILQISDFHNANLKYNKNLIKEIKNIDSDIIVISGDLIDAKTKNYENTYTFIDNLIKINPNTYFVNGNHEWRNRNHNKFLREIKNRKVINLNNKNDFYNNNDININICGIDDPYTNHENIDLAFKNINTNYFTILISHSPNIIFKNKNLLCDLILCGHTHGGQIRLPFIGAIISSGQGFFPKYDKGLYKLNNNTRLYIDSGVGSGYIPIRTLNQSQMSLITIIGKK